jgi:hypothetical protein
MLLLIWNILWLLVVEEDQIMVVEEPEDLELIRMYLLLLKLLIQ